MLKALGKSQELPEKPESPYREIVESQTELICRFQPDGSLTFANSAFSSFFHQNPQDLTSQVLFSMFEPPVRQEWLDKLGEICPNSPSGVIETELQIGPEQTCWLQWNLSGVFDARGGLVEIQSIGRDITAQKQAEISAARHTREMSALHKATAALLTTLELEALLGQILDAATSAIPAAEKGLLHLIARDTGQLEMRAVLGFQETDPRIQKLTNPNKKGFIARAVTERRPLLLHDLQADAALRQGNGKIPEFELIHSVIVAPLILGEYSFGALSLGSRTSGAFDEGDLQLVVSFAATATAAIRNAQLHAEVQKQAITDELTDIYNRRGFFELGQHEIERALRFDRALAAIMLDVDHFKVINDTYGHPVGDEILRMVAQRCSGNIRKVDILGRYGGDEFAILLPEIELFAAVRVAERLRSCIAAEEYRASDYSVPVSISLGVAKITLNTPDLEHLLARADMAMYKAKQTGRNRVEVG